MIKRITIVEGHDLAGKSTLIEDMVRVYESKNEALGTNLRLKVIKGSSFELAEMTDEEQLAYLRREIEEASKDEEVEEIIFDRYIFSNFIYAPLYGKRQVSEKVRTEMVELLKKHNEDCVVQIILLSQPQDEIQRRLDERGDEHIKTLKELEIIKSLYENLFLFEGGRKEFSETLDWGDTLIPFSYRTSGKGGQPWIAIKIIL